MNNEQQNNSPNITDRLPVLLAFYNAFQPAAMERVIKKKCRRFETAPCFLWLERFFASSQEYPGNS